MMPAPSSPENPALRTFKVIVFALAGAGLVVAAGSEAGSTWSFLSRARPAAGEVVRLRAGGAHPEVRFVTDGGREVNYAQNGMIWGYRTGDRVTVLYDPVDPARDPVVRDAGAIWGFNVMNFLLGVVFILMAYWNRRPGADVR